VNTKEKGASWLRSIFKLEKKQKDEKSLWKEEEQGANFKTDSTLGLNFVPKE